jgi:hypothetical protein
LDRNFRGPPLKNDSNLLLMFRAEMKNFLSSVVIEVLKGPVGKELPVVELAKQRAFCTGRQ